MMKKIAIVTPEIAGLHKNGGIGTNYFFHARFLNEVAKYQVTILFTGSCSQNALREWRAQNVGIRLETFPEFSGGVNSELFQRRSAAVHQWLMAETWDEIHFPEYLAHGFICVQAKRSGLAYQNTRLVVTMHSSSLWVREAMQMWSLNPDADVKLDYAERYCCENADTLISPSHYMIGWAERKGWHLPPSRIVLSRLYGKTVGENLPSVQINLRHLVFFGRLETRKGIGIFCEAIERLIKDGHAPARVDFLGKMGTYKGQSAEHYLRQKSLQWQGIHTQIHTDLDCFAAVKHIRNTGGLVVIPSLCDNLPYTVIECINNQIPFVASNVGGIPEMADARVLFAPAAHSLATKLEEFSRLPANTRFNHPYQLETVRKTWKQFVETLFENSATPAVLPSAPKISVCVPFFNHGNYLPDALASLAAQTYENFEVVVVDDGSTDENSRAQFDRLQKKYLPPQFRFFKQENAGVGAARNFAAAQTTGDLLVFVDSDNVAKEHMLAIFVRAMQVSQADCATCHYDIFRDDIANIKKTPLYTCAPLGPCLEAGWRVNNFGDANFIVKKNVFLKLGGFATDRSAVEDWQFLIRLTCQDFRQIVIPETLYWYRFLADSMIRTADAVRIARIIFKTYQEGMSSWPASIIENYAFAPFLSGMSGNTITINSQAAPARPAAACDHRGKFFKKLKKSCVKRALEFAGFISRL